MWGVVLFFGIGLLFGIYGSLLNYLFGLDFDYGDKETLGCGGFFCILISIIVIIIGSILDAKGILPRNGDGDFTDFGIKWGIISQGVFLVVLVIACLVKATFDNRVGAVASIALSTTALLILWGIAFLVGNILFQGNFIPDSAVEGGINEYIFKRGGVAVACILGILTIVRLIRAVLPGDQNSAASDSTNTPPPPPIRSERK